MVAMKMINQRSVLIQTRSSHKGPPPWHYPYKQGEASSSNDVEKPKQVIEATSGVKVRHENNDLPQKIEDIVIEHFKPDHGMFRDCRSS